MLLLFLVTLIKTNLLFHNVKLNNVYIHTHTYKCNSKCIARVTASFSYRKLSEALPVVTVITKNPQI